MQFGQPQFLPLLSLTLLPLLVHLLARRRRRVVPFSMTRFLKEASLQVQGRRWLREILLVLLRTGAVLFALLMLVRPYVPIGLPLPPAPSAIALVIDNSLSMRGFQESAIRDKQRTWFYQALQWCERLVQGTSAEIAIFAADQIAKPVCPFTADKERLRKALWKFPPPFKALDLTAGLQTADALLKMHPAAVKRIIVVTDLQSEPFRSLHIPSLRHPIIIADVKPKPQVGNARVMTMVQLPLDPNTNGIVTATVQNLSYVPLQGKASLLIAQRIAAEQSLTLPPNTERQLTFELPAWAITTADKHGFVKGKVVWKPKLRGSDVLAADNLVHFAFKSPAKLQFLNAIANGRNFVDGALQATGLSTKRGILGAIISSAPDDTSKAEKLAKEMLSFGGAVLFADNPHSPIWGILGLKVQQRTWKQARRITWVDESHPLLHGLGQTLQTVKVWKATAIDPNQSSVKVLATLDDGTHFLVERFVWLERLPYHLRLGPSPLHQPPSRCLIVACGLDGKSSNLPLTPAFVPLLHRLVVYVALNGVTIVPREKDGEARLESGLATIPPKSESDFRLPSPQRLQAALKQHGGSLITVDRPPTLLESTPLRDLSSLCLALTLCCLLAEGILTAMWWRKR